LCVTRSLKHISAQIVDDSTGKTLISASTQDREHSPAIKVGGNCAAAALIGKSVAQRAQAAGITTVCFDRGPYRYHGRVAAVADAAREAGLSF
jgi:large subunit ribosomal protein L18